MSYSRDGIATQTGTELPFTPGKAVDGLSLPPDLLTAGGVRFLDAGRLRPAKLSVIIQERYESSQCTPPPRVQTAVYKGDQVADLEETYWPHL